jgi:hypothetical protein
MRGVGDGRQNEQAHINLGESHTRRRGHERGMMGRDGAVMGRTPPPKARIRSDQVAPFSCAHIIYEH